MGKNAVKEERGANGGPPRASEPQNAGNMVKFEVFGEELLEKWVKPSGNSGRVYLPPDWVGRRVKVIKMG